jgi:hypothetical protein
MSSRTIDATPDFADWRELAPLPEFGREKGSTRSREILRRPAPITTPASHFPKGIALTSGHKIKRAKIKACLAIRKAGPTLATHKRCS